MSGGKRFFVEGEIGQEAAITGAEYHHAVNVVRIGEGDEVVLCNGDGYDYKGRVTRVDKRSVFVSILSAAKNECDPEVEVILFQALCKGERMEWIAQKCNELGVSKIVPFVSRFTTVSARSHKAERMERIAIESSKQCGRSAAAEIAPIANFAQALEEASRYDRIVVAYERAQNGDLRDALEGAGSLALFVGSEGGFAPEEIEEIVRIGGGVVTMGPRVLRAETAAVALTSAVMCLLGEWKR